MQESINEKVSMITKYDRSTGLVSPVKMRWQGRDYEIKSVSYHHVVKDGKKLLHIFHVTDDASDFRLRLDTETLHWTLEEIYDGAATESQ